MTLILDLMTRLVTVVDTYVGYKKEYPTMCDHVYDFGAIAVPGHPLPEKRHGYTNDLVGKRIQWHYGPEFSIIHVYYHPNYVRATGNFYWDADNGTLNPDDLFIGTFTEEYREYCHRMVDWAKHGVWPSNAITNVTHINDLFNDDKSASDICMYKSANEDIIRQRAKGNDAEYFNIMPENASTRISPYNYDALAITAFCKNRIRCCITWRSLRWAL